MISEQLYWIVEAVLRGESPACLLYMLERYFPQAGVHPRRIDDVYSHVARLLANHISVSYFPENPACETSNRA